MPSTRNETENYNRIMEIMNVAVCKGLREIFKQEWDKHHGTTKGLWDDTRISGNELFNTERTRTHAKSYLQLFQAGNRSEWDCSALFDAILYSNAIKLHLSPHVSNKVDELRVLRNNLIHSFGSQHKMSDAAFENACKKIRNCFKVLKLSTTDVQRIRNSSRANHLTRLWEMRYIFLTVLIIGLLSVFIYLVTKPTQNKTLFRVLPTRPVHLIANRSRTVAAILEELQNLAVRSKHALTHLYISGNPGSGKSQLARLVGQQYGTNIQYSWFQFSCTTFVMTLNGRSLNAIYQSYVEFARLMDCNENNIANIVNSNFSTTEMKTESLKTEIKKMLRNFKNNYTWLLIVDNVAKLREISSFLPQLEDEDLVGGQVLITTQDMSSVPPNSPLTAHISVSEGMDPAESCEFLNDLSGIVENQDFVSKIAKQLDYQPLALASAAFYVKHLRESKSSSQFTWKEYLKKLNEGKRNLTELKLRDVNQAYSLTMSTAVLLAVETFAESDSILKHAFTFLSYVSHEAQSLEGVVNYVLRIDKENDKEDVGLRIEQCCLVLLLDDQTVVSISTHRVVHDSIKLFTARYSEQNTKLRVPLYIFQVLLRHICALGEIAMIPHLKAFHGKTKNLPSLLVPGSLKFKQEMQTQIFDLTSCLISHGEFLLSKYILTLAVKIATNERDKNKKVFQTSSHISFPKIGEIYFNLGVVESKLGNMKQARKYYEQALKIFKRQHGTSHESVSKCYGNLGSLSCSNLQECSEGVKYSELALEINRSPETEGFYYSNLGNMYFNEAKLHAETHNLRDPLLLNAQIYFLLAKKSLLEALDMHGPKWNKLKLIVSHVAVLYSNLGGIQYLFGNHEVSEKYFRNSIKMFSKVTGRNHLDLGTSYFNLGLVHFKLNELQEAEDCFRRALEIYSQQLEPSHEKIKVVVGNLAAVLEEAGQRNEAQYLSQKYGTCTCRIDRKIPN